MGDFFFFFSFFSFFFAFLNFENQKQLTDDNFCRRKSKRRFGGGKGEQAQTYAHARAYTPLTFQVFQMLNAHFCPIICIMSNLSLIKRL